jgi:hypothetical protein
MATIRATPATLIYMVKARGDETSIAWFGGVHVGRACRRRRGTSDASSCVRSSCGGSVAPSSARRRNACRSGSCTARTSHANWWRTAARDEWARRAARRYDRAARVRPIGGRGRRNQAGSTSERDRIKSIITSDQAKGREELAHYFACDTELSGGLNGSGSAGKIG